MKTLNDKQLKFLVYLRDNHKSVGYPLTVNYILANGSYTDSEITVLIDDFRRIRKLQALQKHYGVPTKYLKG